MKTVVKIVVLGLFPSCQCVFRGKKKNFCFTLNVTVQSSVCSAKTGKCLTRYRCVKSKGLQAGELFAPGLLHTVTENVLPGVQLQQLDAAQQLIGLLQSLTGIFLKA